MLYVKIMYAILRELGKIVLFAQNSRMISFHNLLFMGGSKNYVGSIFDFM